MHNGFAGVFSAVYIRSDVFFLFPVRLTFLLTTLTTPNQGEQDVRFVFDCVLHD